MNKMSKLCSCLVIGGVIAGALAGCSSNASTSQSTNASAPNVQNGHRNAMLKKIEDAGASQTDAEALVKLMRKKHVQSKWIIDQLKNKQSVSSIEKAINDGKAPIAQIKQTKKNAANSNSSTDTTKE